MGVPSFTLNGFRACGRMCWIQQDKGLCVILHVHCKSAAGHTFRAGHTVRSGHSVRAAHHDEAGHTVLDND